MTVISHHWVWPKGGFPGREEVGIEFHWLRRGRNADEFSVARGEHIEDKRVLPFSVYIAVLVIAPEVTDVLPADWPIFSGAARCSVSTITVAEKSYSQFRTSVITAKGGRSG